MPDLYVWNIAFSSTETCHCEGKAQRLFSVTGAFFFQLWFQPILILTYWGHDKDWNQTFLIDYEISYLILDRVTNNPTMIINKILIYSCLNPGPDNDRSWTQIHQRIWRAPACPTPVRDNKSLFSTAQLSGWKENTQQPRHPAHQSLSVWQALCPPVHGRCFPGHGSVISRGYVCDNHLSFRWCFSILKLRMWTLRAETQCYVIVFCIRYPNG